MFGWRILTATGIKNLHKYRAGTGASAVSDGYSKTWHMIFMIAGNGHFSEAKSANIQSIRLYFPFEK